MSFSLSPTISPLDVEAKATLRRLKVELHAMAERAYDELKAGSPNVNYLALEEDQKVWKRLQRQQQRLRKAITPIMMDGPLDALAKSMVTRWIEAKEQFYENIWVQAQLNQSKLVKVGNIWFVVDWDHAPKKMIKDRRCYFRQVGKNEKLSVERNANAKQVHLFEDEIIKAKPVKTREFNMVTTEDAAHAERTRPKMHRPANLGNGRGARPLPPNMEWKWDNEVGYVVVRKRKKK